MEKGAEVRIRRMTRADLAAVVEIAQSLPAAPHWPAAAYLAALDPERMPRRVALAALEVGVEGQEHSSGAKQPAERLGTEGGGGFNPRIKPAESAGFSPGWTVLRDLAVVGFAIASLVTPQAELEMIAVASEAQRQGIARRLFVALTQELRLAGVTEIILEVRISNQSALSLYRQSGFRETGLRRGYYADPVEDAVLMSLSIGI
jgi:ribosomal-protein-alanine acetyltransferase